MALGSSEKGTNMPRTDDLDAIWQQSDPFVREYMQDFALEVLANAKDEYDAEQSIGDYVERAMEYVESIMKPALTDLIEEWYNQDCEECDGSGECPDCEWMRRDNPEVFATEIAECGGCGGTGCCNHCEGSGAEFQR
jgi:hypothetical protein